ncbi:hypothetical protein NEOKW01_0198 [Nematocida sp. AWRm80]|nr:hypothetical protein NEOKW01_0198 [Nematocida sp. AWRm80]
MLIICQIYLYYIIIIRIYSSSSTPNIFSNPINLLADCTAWIGDIWHTHSSLDQTLIYNDDIEDIDSLCDSNYAKLDEEYIYLVDLSLLYKEQQNRKELAELGKTLNFLEKKHLNYFVAKTIRFLTPEQFMPISSIANMSSNQLKDNEWWIIHIKDHNSRNLQKVPNQSNIYIDTTMKVVYLLPMDLRQLIYLNNDLDYTLCIIFRTGKNKPALLSDSYRMFIKMYKGAYKRIILYFPITQFPSCINKYEDGIKYLNHPYVTANDRYMAIHNTKLFALNHYIAVGFNVLELFYSDNFLDAIIIKGIPGVRHLKYLGIRISSNYIAKFPKDLFLFCKNENDITIQNLALILPKSFSLLGQPYTMKKIRMIPGDLEISCDIWYCLLQGDVDNMFEFKYYIKAQRLIVHPCQTHEKVNWYTMSFVYPFFDNIAASKTFSSTYIYTVAMLLMQRGCICSHLSAMYLYIPKDSWNSTIDLLSMIYIDRQFYPVLNSISIISTEIDGYTTDYPFKIDVSMQTNDYVRIYCVNYDNNRLNLVNIS